MCKPTKSACFHYAIWVNDDAALETRLLCILVEDCRRLADRLVLAMIVPTRAVFGLPVVRATMGADRVDVIARQPNTIHIDNGRVRAFIAGLVPMIVTAVIVNLVRLV